MKKVLVADDKAPNRELIRTILEQAGHLVLEASDRTEALRNAQQNRPDLIVLDLHMPMLDGFLVFEELRRDERFAATPIIALTASAMQGDRERALAAGRTGYLAKPVSVGVFRREMERLLG